MFISCNANLVEFMFNNGVVARIVHPTSDDLRYHGPVMKRRATCILDATLVDDEYTSTAEEDKAGVIMKASWQDKTRDNEVHIIEKAVEVLEQSEETKAFLKHLPKVMGWNEFTAFDSGILSEELRGMPSVRPGKPRILRLILFRRLEPLDVIKNENMILNVWLDCFKCHYALWNKGIRHGDISVWNLMRDTVTGLGVLNGFDLAVVKTDDPANEKRGGERTGTLPFMAVETLGTKFANGELPRKYIHEVECFVWVLAWLCIRHIKLGDLGKCDWRVGLYDQVKSAKSDFMTYCQKWVKSHYTKAGERCLLMVKFLFKDIVSLAVDWEESGLPGEIFPDEVYKRVIELVTVDLDKTETSKSFRERIRDKIEEATEYV